MNESLTISGLSYEELSRRLRSSKVDPWVDDENTSDSESDINHESKEIEPELESGLNLEQAIQVIATLEAKVETLSKEKNQLREEINRLREEVKAHTYLKENEQNLHLSSDVKQTPYDAEEDVVALVSNFVSDMKSSDFYHNVDATMMAVISFVDHWTDILLVIFWLSDDSYSHLPFSIALMGIFFISTTSILPILVVQQWYVKISMPIGLGMIALIYRLLQEKGSQELLQFGNYFRKNLERSRVEVKRHQNFVKGFSYVQWGIFADYYEKVRDTYQFSKEMNDLLILTGDSNEIMKVQAEYETAIKREELLERLKTEETSMQKENEVLEKSWKNTLVEQVTVVFQSKGRMDNINQSHLRKLRNYLTTLFKGKYNSDSITKDIMAGDSVNIKIDVQDVEIATQILTQNLLATESFFSEITFPLNNLSHVRIEEKELLNKRGTSSKIHDEYLQQIDCCLRQVNSNLLGLYAPKTYKVVEAICESIPQILLQCYVALKYSTEEDDVFLYVSLAVSIISNTYAGAMLLFPQGLGQISIAFSFCFFDMIFRCGGILFLCVCTSFGWARGIILFLYAFLGTAYVLFYMISTGEKMSAYTCIMSILVNAVVALSSSAAFFFLTSGLNKEFKDVNFFFKYEFSFRLVITTISLAVGRTYSSDYDALLILILNASFLSLIILYFMDNSFENIKTPPRGEFAVVIGNEIVRNIQDLCVQMPGLIISLIPLVVIICGFAVLVLVPLYVK